MIRVSKPKNEMPIEGLNSSGSKTNSMRRIKVSNLEPSGHAVSAAKKNHDDSDTFFFFIYLFIYLLSKSHCLDKSFETTKARNLKFGQMISLYKKLRTSNFEFATSRGLGQMHQNL